MTTLWCSRYASCAVSCSIGLLALAACGDSGTGGGDQGGGAPAGGGGAGGGAAAASGQLDILFVVDNSIGMGEKQRILGRSAAAFVRELASPPCIDATGAVVDQPGSPDAACASGSRRHAPVRDIHVGVISSSLGAAGTTVCASAANGDDRAHLIDRSDGVTGYAGQPFVKYDPLQQAPTPGDPDAGSFADDVEALIAAVGEAGCGYEMPLEAAYRFLADPEPYETIAEDGDQVSTSGIDQVVLQQRAEFLRPDSNVALVFLSDENDCSANIHRQANLVFRPAPFFRATSACAEDENDECCTSCALPSDCGVDPACESDMYTELEDPPNLTCFDQKRRYGVDFLMPTARYMNALSEPVIDSMAIDLSPGPIDTEDNPLFANGRSVSRVLVLSLVGAPWQDVVEDPTDPGSRVLSSDELDDLGRWEVLFGGDPFVRGSIAQRTGDHPLTGASVSADNDINGGDRTISLADDLQYTCIFPLETPVPGAALCEECAVSCDDPACDGAEQVAAAAYPGNRFFEVARGLGDRGVLGSVCPGDLQTGYGSALRALTERLSRELPSE